MDNVRKKIVTNNRNLRERGTLGPREQDDLEDEQLRLQVCGSRVRALQCRLLPLSLPPFKSSERNSHSVLMLNEFEWVFYLLMTPGLLGNDLKFLHSRHRQQCAYGNAFWNVSLPFLVQKVEVAV